MPIAPAPRITSRSGSTGLSSSCVLVIVLELSRSPGMSGTLGSEPVFSRIVSAVIVRCWPSTSTRTVCGSTKVAWPVISSTVSMASIASRLPARMNSRTAWTSATARA